MGRTSNAKERLLEVAFGLIWQQSYGSVSVDSICNRAKVKKGSFYYFFPSKSDLAVAAYEEHWQQKRPSYDQTFSPQVPPLERIESFCQHIYEGQKDKKEKTGRVLGCPFASVGCELSTQDEKIRQKTEEVAERVTRYLTGAIRDAAEEGSIKTDDPAQLAKEAYCFVVGLLMQAKIQNDPELLKRLKPGFARILGTSLEVAEPA